MNRTLFALLVPCLCLMTSCGQSAEEKVVEALEAMAEVLDTVQDEESAEAAAPKLQEIAAGMKETAQELRTKYGNKRPSDYDIDDELKERIRKVQGRMVAAMLRLSDDEEALEALGRSMSSMGGTFR